MKRGTERPKVMHLCAPGAVGGLERVVELLAGGMYRAGVEVHVVAVLSPELAQPEWLTRLSAIGVHVHSVRVGGRQLRREAQAVNALLTRITPDVVHSHGYRCDLLHGHRVRRHGAVSATTLHGSSRMGGASHVFEWIQGWALRRFDVVVAVSEPLRRELLGRGVSEDRIAPIPNGWAPPPDALLREEARATLGVRGLGPVLGWVGRLIPIKGCDVFLDALRLLEAEPWQAIVLGDGPERERLEAHANRLGLEGRVRFLGSVSEASRLFAALDVFVLSSRSEGTPMVLLEAMGAGVPVVATDVGGVRAALGPAAGRWVSKPEDPAALAGEIRALMTARQAGTPDIVSGAVNAGQRRARDDFGEERWVTRHLEAYGLNHAQSGGRPAAMSGERP